MHVMIITNVNSLSLNYPALITKYLQYVHSLPEAVVRSIKLVSEVRCRQVRTANGQSHHGRCSQENKVIKGVLIREMKEDLCQLNTHLRGGEKGGLSLSLSLSLSLLYTRLAMVGGCGKGFSRGYWELSLMLATKQMLLLGKHSSSINKQ